MKYAKKCWLMLEEAKRRLNLPSDTRRPEIALAVAQILGRKRPSRRDQQYQLLSEFMGVEFRATITGKTKADRRAEARAKALLRPVKPKAAPQPTIRFEATPEFLQGFEWRKLRMVVLTKRGARCECCGSTPADDIRINVDHIKPRKLFPELALVESNLQILCDVCNHGKGNWDQTDWRAERAQLDQEKLTPHSRDGDGDEQNSTLRPKLVRRR